MGIKNILVRNEIPLVWDIQIILIYTFHPI
jgi:hypothetical protein